MSAKDVLAWLEYDRKKDEEKLEKMFRVEPKTTWDDVVKCCFECYQNNSGFGQHRRSTKEECDYKDKHLPDGWVKCSERVPPRNAYVLAYGNYLGTDIYRIACHIPEKQVTNQWITQGGMFVPEITHWRCFPPPPKDN